MVLWVRRGPGDMCRMNEVPSRRQPPRQQVERPKCRRQAGDGREQFGGLVGAGKTPPPAEANKTKENQVKLRTTIESPKETKTIVGFYQRFCAGS